jgi:hypothetical protein
VQSYDAKNNTAILFGRRLRMSASSAAGSALERAVASGETAELTVFATLGKKGQLKRASAIVVAGQYVPGASHVVVSGAVSSVDPSTATAVIGQSRVDYSGLLADREIKLALGDIVTIVGTLPELSQSILATELVERKRR